MREVKKYIAYDGTEFFYETECETYEKENKAKLFETLKSIKKICEGQTNPEGRNPCETCPMQNKTDGACRIGDVPIEWDID